jgi:nitroreductase
MMGMLDLTPDQVLTTTRSVRKRLDLTRPVEPELIRECLEIAMQAPSGGNLQTWHFVVVTDDARRKALGDIYRRGWDLYVAHLPPLPARLATDAERAATQSRVRTSADYLAEHMYEVPALLIPCAWGRVDGQPAAAQAGYWGSVYPAVWSFMLAARARGLGTALTSVHLQFEREAAAVVGIPYERVTQAGLIPVAYTLGTDFSPAPRAPLDTVLHWDQW